MKLTPQQLEFISTSTDESASIALRARAGTSKTFCLQKWSSATSKSGLSTSFSKSTVVELSKKVSTRFPAKTLHALGRSAIKSAGKLSKLDSSKIYNIVKQLGEEHDLTFETQTAVRKLAGLGKTHGLQPDPNGPAGLLSNDESVWEPHLAYLADMHDVDYNDEVKYFTAQAIIESNNLALNQGIIDFDDMLYIPIIYQNFRFPRYPVILADEVQDFNALQHTMLRRCLLPGGRIIAAGDDRQAIYGFRGALSDSYSLLVKSFNMKELPLTVSFRCPSEVVRVAQHYVPDIEAAPTAITGEVLYPVSLDLQDLPTTILCRNNAPLIRLALHLLVNGRTAEVAGQDIGQGLVSLTKRITKKNLSSEKFLTRLYTWRDREIERYPRRKARVEDKVAALRALARVNPDLNAIQNHLTKLYPNPTDKDYVPAQYKLSTIHRAKGQEWPNVLFLDPQLLPSKYASQSWELLQEDNLSYVGVTRAQQTLTFAASAIINGLVEE